MTTSKNFTSIPKTKHLKQPLYSKTHKNITLKKDLAEEMEHFRSINEKSVDDVSLAFFYKPHTLTLLSVCVLGLLYSAFTR